jgi:hypothetical protein
LYSLWREEKQVLTSLRDLNMVMYEVDYKDTKTKKYIKPTFGGKILSLIIKE